MNKEPKKHAELIHAWADGAEIQHRRNALCDWTYCAFPRWDDAGYFRIKPKTKKETRFIAVRPSTGDVHDTMYGNYKVLKGVKPNDTWQIIEIAVEVQDD